MSLVQRACDRESIRSDTAADIEAVFEGADVMRNSVAISEFDRPAAHAQHDLRALSKPCAVVRRRAHCSRVVRSLGLTVTRTVRRPRFAIRASLHQKYEGRGAFLSESQIRGTRTVLQQARLEEDRPNTDAAGDRHDRRPDQRARD